MNNYNCYFHDIGDTFCFGRHKNQLLCDVIADDPTYLDWCIANIYNFRMSEQTLEEIKLLFPDFTMTETIIQHVGKEFKLLKTFYDGEISDWKDSYL